MDGFRFSDMGSILGRVDGSWLRGKGLVHNIWVETLFITIPCCCL